MIKKITPTNNRTGNISLKQEEKEAIENGEVSEIKLMLGHGRRTRLVHTVQVEDWMVKAIKIMATDQGVVFWIMPFRKV